MTEGGRIMGARFVQDAGDPDYYLVEVDDPDSRWGFHLTDGDQSWDGGFGAGMTSWLCVPAEQVPPGVREEMGWVIEEVG